MGLFRANGTMGKTLHLHARTTRKNWTWRFLLCFVLEKKGVIFLNIVIQSRATLWNLLVNCC